MPAVLEPAAEAPAVGPATAVTTDGAIASLSSATANPSATPTPSVIETTEPGTVNADTEAASATAPVDPTMLGAGAIVVAVLLGTGVWLWIRKKNSTT
ncbi:hypothetical protein [Arthrobacter sp. Soil736]|uniref:hypothetical protein n=1 Tax=Arthrobacter sp. Soil736 TaxID=1736395 RepID=UPI00138F0B14|nr:hypothetical protein [Arthrobacter sp. Soil736]